MKLIKCAIILLIFTGISLYGCEDRSRKSASANDFNPQEQSEVSNGKDLDILKGKIASLDAQFNVINKKVDNIKKELDYEKSKNTWAIIIAILSIIISMIIVIYTIIISRETHKIQTQLKGQLDQEIENLKTHLNELERKLTNTIRNGRGISSDSNPDYGMVDPRSNFIHKSTITSGTTEPLQTPEPPRSKTGYFEVPIGGNGKGYFKALLGSKDDYVCFSASISETKAEFSPIVSLENIISIDNMDFAIQFEGVSKREARTMVIINPGTAKKEGERWIITEKAIVELKK